MTVTATETASSAPVITLDPKLGEKIQFANVQMMAVSVLCAIFSIALSAKLLSLGGLLHGWVMYVPLALGVIVGYFGQQLNEKINGKMLADDTRNTPAEVREYVSQVYGITLKDDVKLETVRVDEKDKIRIDPASLAATSQLSGEDIRVSVTFTPDYKAVVVKKLTNDEWFAESAASIQS